MLVVFYIVTLFPSLNEYGIFLRLFSFPQTYMAIFLFTSGYVLVDSGLHYLDIEINSWLIAKKEREETKAKKKAALDPTSERRRVSFYNSKLYTNLQYLHSDLFRPRICILWRSWQ